MTSHDTNVNSHHSYTPYIIGFILSIILTAIPFAVVMHGGFSKPAMVWTVVTMAVVQIFVHLKYFLHLDFVTEDGKLNSIAFMFTTIIIVMIVALSVWLIYESNAMMMY